VGRALAEPVTGADIGEGGSGICVTGEVLQVDDIRPSLPCGGQSRHSERMHGHVGIEAEPSNVPLDQLLDRPDAHRLESKAIAAHAASCLGGWKQGPSLVISDSWVSQPAVQPLDGFKMKRRGSFLAALAGDVQDPMLAVGLVIADPEPDQLADA